MGPVRARINTPLHNATECALHRPLYPDLPTTYENGGEAAVA